jgi:hypothetical protein
MNRSIRRVLRQGFTALVAGLMVLAMLAPSAALAGTPYTIHWVLTEDANSCGEPWLATNGGAYFHANGTPLPTFEVPDAYMEHADGSRSNEAEAPFDSVLLRPGANDFFFGVQATGGNNGCVHNSNLVTLVSAPLGLNKLLFNVRRDGTAFAGITRLGLSLTEINPPLARDIANLEVAIAEQRKQLIANASKVADLAEKLDLLRQLDTELHDLVNRPLDEITQADLDAILDRYSEVVDEATKAALEQLIADLQKSITDLQNELYSLIDQFGAQADAVADLITQGASDTGWNPDDPSSYALGPSDVPWVEVPDISGIPGAFDPGNDPYAAYADSVIASLEADVSGGAVIARASFVAKVRAWRANDKALEQAIVQQMGVSQAEVNAFLQARIRVTSYLQQFMDATDWFLDSKIPADVRVYADGILKQAFGQLAEQLKDNLNLWDDSAQSPELLETIRAFGGAMSTIGSGFTAYAETMQGLVHATTRIGIGFVPVVGTALDLCEAMTGKEWCLPSGRELSTEERIFSATGAAIGGVVKYYAGVKNAGVGAGAIVVAGKTGQLGDDFAKALMKNRRTWFKTLRGAITSNLINAFEVKAGKYLLDDGRALIGVGDDGVRKVLGIPKTSSIPDAARAPDFLSVTPGNKLALSEVKGGASFEVTEDAIPQLTNAMKKLKELGLAGDVERVEIIVQKGAKLGNNCGTKDGYLFNKLNGKTVNIDDFPLLFIKVIEL